MNANGMLLEKITTKSPKEVLTTKIKNLIFHPFSEVLCVLPITKGFQLNARAYTLNINFSAIYFDSKSIYHGSAKHLL